MGLSLEFPEVRESSRAEASSTVSSLNLFREAVEGK